MKYLSLAASMILGIVGQFLIKKGVAETSPSLNISSILSTLFNPFSFFGFFAYGVSSIIWLFVLQKFPLSVAYPALSLTYVAIVILSARYFDEPLTLFKSIGIILIIGGVYLLFR
jgi:drug/metabolite transporter (DMT)-like permease